MSEIPESTRRYRRLVDPNTGEDSTESDAITYNVYRLRRPVDPKKGTPSDAADAIPYGKYLKQRLVDPDDGRPSDKPNAIKFSTYWSRMKYDPITKKRSKDGVSYSTLRGRELVDPHDGKPSTKPDAITRGMYTQRKKVITKDGDILPYYKAYAHRKVNPKDGAPSDDGDAIKYSVYKLRQLVDENGRPDPYGKMTYNMWLSGKRVNPANGDPDENGIRRDTFYRRRKKAVMIKQEPHMLVLNPDENIFKRVATTLRGPISNFDNCTYLVEAFIGYLLTSVEPTKPILGQSPSLEHITFIYIIDKIKTEDTVSYSWIDRNTQLGSYAPPGEIYPTTDLTREPIYDVDYFEQHGVNFDVINQVLMKEAELNGGLSFGMIDITRCGDHVDDLRHCIVYHSTSEKVLYIDCRYDEPVFGRLEDKYTFMSSDIKLTDDIFNDTVFYTPCCPKQLKRKRIETSGSRKRRKTSSTEDKMQVDD